MKQADLLGQGLYAPYTAAEQRYLPLRLRHRSLGQSLCLPLQKALNGKRGFVT